MSFIITQDQLRIADKSYEGCVTENRLKTYLSYLTSVPNLDIDVVFIGLPLHQTSKFTASEFFKAFLSDGLTVAISNKDLHMEDAVTEGIYIQLHSEAGFKRFTSCNDIILSKVVIDSKAPKVMISSYLDHLSESRYTKNKKVVFANPFSINILHDSIDELNYVGEMIYRSTVKYKS